MPAGIGIPIPRPGGAQTPPGGDAQKFPSITPCPAAYNRGMDTELYWELFRDTGDVTAFLLYREAQRLSGAENTETVTEQRPVTTD